MAGRTVWRVLFDLPDRNGHLYLNLFTKWYDTGDAIWHFHVKLA